MLKPNVRFTANVYQQVLYTKQKISTSDGEETKEYIGMKAGTFKKRYVNHKKSLNVPRFSAETEYNINWSILKRARAYTPGAARCQSVP
jgi:hypothetical protein